MNVEYVAALIRKYLHHCESIDESCWLEKLIFENSGIKHYTLECSYLPALADFLYNFQQLYPHYFVDLSCPVLLAHEFIHVKPVWLIPANA